MRTYKYTLAVEVLGQRVSMAISRHGKNQNEFVQYRRADFDGTSVGAAAALSGLLKHSFFKPKITRVVGILPRSQAIIRYLTLPSLNDPEIHQMAQLQVGKYIPFSREDVMADTLILGKDEQTGYSRVLLIAYPRGSVDELVGIMIGAGAIPDALTCSSCALVNWFRSYLSGKPFVAEQLNMVINIDDENMEILVLRGDRLEYSRSVRMGESQIHHDGVADFFEHVDRTLDGFLKQSSASGIDRIILISSNPVMEVYRDHLREEYQVPVEILSATEKIPTAARFQWPAEAERHDSILTVNIGGVCLSSDDGPNFVPPQIDQSRRASQRRAILTRLAIGVGLSCVLALVALSAGAYKKQQYLDSLKEEIKNTAGQVERIERQQEEIQAMTSMLKERVYLTEVIRQLYDIVPEETSLSTLSVSDQKILVLQGMTVNGSDVSRIQDGLVNSNMFDDVVLDYVNKRTRRQTEITYFKITSRLKKEI